MADPASSCTSGSCNNGYAGAWARVDAGYEMNPYVGAEIGMTVGEYGSVALQPGIGIYSYRDKLTGKVENALTAGNGFRFQLNNPLGPPPSANCVTAYAAFSPRVGVFKAQGADSLSTTGGGAIELGLQYGTPKTGFLRAGTGLNAEFLLSNDSPAKVQNFTPTILTISGAW